MVINHLLTGMILRGIVSFVCNKHKQIESPSKIRQNLPQNLTLTVCNTPVEQSPKPRLFALLYIDEILSSYIDKDPHEPITNHNEMSCQCLNLAVNQLLISGGQKLTDFSIHVSHDKNLMTFHSTGSFPIIPI